MQIENLTKEKGVLTGENNLWQYNLGKVKKNVPVTFKLLLKDVEHSSVKFGCPSCTTGKAAQKEKDVEIEITYKAVDAKDRPFTKTVTETLKNGTQVAIKFNGIIV